jgi:hypothetical protein
MGWSGRSGGRLFLPFLSGSGGEAELVSDLLLCWYVYGYIEYGVMCICVCIVHL